MKKSRATRHGDRNAQWIEHNSASSEVKPSPLSRLRYGYLLGQNAGQVRLSNGDEESDKDHNGRKNHTQFSFGRRSKQRRFPSDHDCGISASFAPHAERNPCGF